MENNVKGLELTVGMLKENGPPLTNHIRVLILGASGSCPK